LPPKAHFACGSADALPFRSGRFDLTLAVTSLCFVRHPDHAVSEMHRVLQPGGRLVLGDWISQEGDPRDIILKTGEGFRIDRRRLVIAQALEVSRIVVIQKVRVNIPTL